MKINIEGMAGEIITGTTAHEFKRITAFDSTGRNTWPRAVAIPLASRQFNYCTLYGVVVDRVFDAPFSGMFVVDIGAHKGYYAANALRQGAVGVISYEPEAQNLAVLRSSAAASSQWAVSGDAIGPYAGQMTLNISTASWSHSSRQPISGSIIATQVVSMRTLASAIDHATARAEGAPLLVKINIEGMAGEIIAGTTPHELNRITALWLDVEGTDAFGAAAIAAHLLAAGLTLTNVAGARHFFLHSSERTNDRDLPSMPTTSSTRQTHPHRVRTRLQHTGNSRLKHHNPGVNQTGGRPQLPPNCTAFELTVHDAYFVVRAK